MRRVPLGMVAAALLLLPVFGCTGAPRTRPVKMGDVDTGLTSVESARRQLKGTWELVSLELLSPSGQKTTADAKGRLVYDEYGNLAITGTITGTNTLDPSALNLTGRVTIDPDKKTLTIAGVQAANADAKRVDPKLDPSLVRYYAFEGDLLKTTIKDANGVATAVATWKKTG